VRYTEVVSEVVDHRQRAAETKRRRSRARLLEAAEELFALRGWHDTRMEDIAARAGVSLATAYTYFKSKRSIMGHTYRPYFLTLQEQLTVDLENVPAVQALERLVFNLSRLMRQKPNLTIAVMTAAREETALDNAPTPDEPDVRQLVPLSYLMINCLQRAKEQHEIPATLPVQDIGTYHTNALLLRIFSHPDETSESTATFVLSQICPVLSGIASGIHEIRSHATANQASVTESGS
jgi:AcrR family transcriptional regulator